MQWKSKPNQIKFNLINNNDAGGGEDRENLKKVGN